MKHFAYVPALFFLFLLMPLRPMEQPPRAGGMEQELNDLFARLASLDKEVRARQLETELHPLLVRAILNNQQDEVRTLLQRGANANYGFGTSRPLSYAIRERNRDMINLLVRAGQGDINNSNGGSLLDQAMTDNDDNGEGSFYTMLLQLGGNPHLVRDVHGDTPLYAAALGGHIRIVLLLLAAGADRKAINPEQRAALVLASEIPNSSHEHILEILDNPQRLFGYAITYGATAAVIRLAHSYNIHRADAQGVTPLARAVTYRHLGIIALLLYLGAQPSQKMIAEVHRVGHTAISELLVYNNPAQLAARQPHIIGRAAAERIMMGQQQSSWGWHCLWKLFWWYS